MLSHYKRVAIVHYWLVGMRGGERVLERLLTLFPQADIFTHVYVPDAVSAMIRERKVFTTFINKLPGAARHYQKYLSLMPLALEQLDLRGYDLVISSEAGPAKGVIAAPDAVHLCYCHSPMRYLWDHYHTYRDSSGRLTRAVMPLLAHRLRQWDAVSAMRVDLIAANSNFIRQRIRRAWRRNSRVVFPPVETDAFAPTQDVEDRYLWVGQMVSYKRPDLVLDAFNRSGKPLLMVGQGAMLDTIKRRAKSNVTVLPQLNFNELRKAYAACRALVFAAEEDFGIVPVEAMASGRPVLAYGRGGVLDTVKLHVSGILFNEQTVESLQSGIDELEAWLPSYDPQAAIAHAQAFAPIHFDEGIRSLLAEASTW